MGRGWTVLALSATMLVFAVVITLGIFMMLVSSDITLQLLDALGT